MLRYRLRKLFAPTVGIREPMLLTSIGALSALIGLMLSFRIVIEPFLEGVENSANRLLGTFVSTESLDLARHIMAGLLLFFGIYLTWRGSTRLIGKVVETLTGRKGGSVDDFVRRQMLASGPRIVALGGGTGLSTLLRGLKTRSSNITAIVTVTDDGGSSGKLIREKGMIPPGDIRNCLVALADAEKAMTDLFQHRFKSDSGVLSGHSIGNLLIAALMDQAQGDFERAIEIASEVLYIRGKVVPATLARTGLRAILEDGVSVVGETNIVESARRIRRIYLEAPDVEAYDVAVNAILEADLICIGPGSVYTSVIPNLLVPGIAEALAKTKARKVYICNVMTQAGESENFTASEHVTAIESNLEHRVFDTVLVNTATPTPILLEKYREKGQHLVVPDMDRIKAIGVRAIGGNFMNETDVVRHDPLKLTARLMALLERN